MQPPTEAHNPSLHVFSLALEPRVLTRWDCRRYAREAYEAGVRYFGGCCGFEPYHMREVAEEVGQVHVETIYAHLNVHI